MESENVASESSLEELYADLIPEQKCPICKTYCKEAVILPCCNRRFCDKCGDRRFAVKSRNSVVRTCYLCHSPSHFIRDCPMASSQHPMSHAGDPMWQGGMPYYAPPPYWDSVAFPPVNPYMNMY